MHRGYLDLIVALSLFLGAGMAGFRGEASACTIFYVADDTHVFAGNNEDFNTLATKIWFIPAEDGKYGRVYFGFDNFVRQGGMNEKGLFFDTIGGPEYAMPHLKGGEFHRGDVIAEAMEYCATVDEVIAYFEEHGPFIDNHEIPAVYGAIMYGDRHGDSVIIEGDNFVRKQGSYQVLTNFFQTRPELGGYPCRRYDIATDALAEHDEYSVDIVREVLAAVHLEAVDGWNPTTYSNIYDLRNGTVHVYHYHNYEDVFSFRLADELAKGPHAWDLPELFRPTMAAGLLEDRESRSLPGKLWRFAGEIGVGATVVVLIFFGLAFLVVLITGRIVARALASRFFRSTLTASRSSGGDSTHD